MSVVTSPLPVGPLSLLDDPLEQQRFTRRVAVGESQLAESDLLLSGMHCAACAGIIEDALRGRPGVIEAHVSAAAQRATVRWDPALTQLSTLFVAVRQAGYDAAPDLAAPARLLRAAEWRDALWRLFVAAFCAMQVMMMAAPSYFAAPGDLAPDLAHLLNWGSWVLSLPVLLFSSAPFFRGAWRSLQSGRIAMDVPVALGIAVTFVASAGATFDPGGLFGSEVYFDSMTMFVSFLLASRCVELALRHRSARALEGATSDMPQTANRINAAGEIEAVSVLRLVVGDRLQVALGQAVPADGLLLEGRTQLDESLLTGESMPQPRHPGDEILAGSVNLGAPLLMQVIRAGADTRFEAIVALMRNAMTQRPASALLADRMAGPFLWVVLLLAGAGAAVWSVLDPSRAVWVAVSVLVVTCPCALSLATPATLIAAAGGLARRGVLVRQMGALDRLAQAEHFVFDKTGTLTESLPTLVAVTFVEGQSVLAHVDQAQQLAAGLAKHSHHPLSRVLAQAVPAGVAAFQDVQELVGLGLEGVDTFGRCWRLGAPAWVDANSPACGQVALGVDGRALVNFTFAEAMRPGALEAVAALKKAGLVVSLLSGDSTERARAMAERLGIEHVSGGATPAAKLEAMARFQASGERLVMVGDGVNDAPVLARADVSIAMGQGAMVARAHADLVLVSSRPLDVVLARNTARKAMGIVKQNLAWAAGYNLACIPLALVGWLPPWAAGLGMGLSSLVVVANAARARV